MLYRQKVRLTRDKYFSNEDRLWSESGPLHIRRLCIAYPGYKIEDCCCEASKQNQNIGLVSESSDTSRTVQPHEFDNEMTSILIIPCQHYDDAALHHALKS